MKVSQETCKLAKEKGYTACNCGIGYPDCVCKGECWFIEQWELQEWLRNIHKLYVLVWHDYDDATSYGTWTPANRWTWEVDNKQGEGYPYTYEEALEAGLVVALNLIK